MSTIEEARRGQVAASAAEIYDRDFVPALFGQFAPLIVEAAGVGPGDRVLDLACGTGIVAMAALERGATVSAVDRNAGMLAVARRKSDAVDWREADAAALPFEDGAFDAVLCQFALMFFADRTAALREAARVTRSGGTLAFLTWDSVPRSPGYAELVSMLGRVVGPEAAGALSAPFVLGDPEAIRVEAVAAGLQPVEIRAVTGTARHPSLDAWVETEVGGWTLADMVSEAQKASLKEEVRATLAGFVQPDGSVAFPAPAQLLLIRV